MGDVHNRGNKLEKTLQKLQNSNYSEKNKELLQEYGYYLSTQVSVERQSRYLSAFNTLEKLIDFDMDQADRKDLIDLVATINRDNFDDKDRSPYTLNEYRKALKSFYKWHKGEEKPEIIDFIQIGVDKKDRPNLDIDELPTPKDVATLIDYMQNPRDKSFIITLWESGGRISEVLNLKWKDMTDHGPYHKLKFRHSKTMQRSVPIRESATLLDNWKLQHPEPDPDSYIFVKFSNGKQVSYRGMQGQLKTAVGYSDIEEHKRTNFHAFRKSRATFLASEGWNVFQLMKFFGWDTPETAMHYIKLAQSNIEKAFLNLYRQTTVDEFSAETSFRGHGSEVSQHPNQLHIPGQKTAEQGEDLLTISV